MKALISLMLVTSLVGAQEVPPPQRGEERREPTRVERPEPVRSHPPEVPQRVEPPRREEPRPEPQRPQPPLVRTVNPPIFLDSWNNPWNRMRFQCWDRWDCRNIDYEFNRIERNRRPRRTEMTLLRERWEKLTPKQRERLLAARKDFREKVQKILNNP